jgi:Fibronectin type III domain
VAERADGATTQRRYWMTRTRPLGNRMVGFLVVVAMALTGLTAVTLPSASPAAASTLSVQLAVGYCVFHVQPVLVSSAITVAVSPFGALGGVGGIEQAVFVNDWGAAFAPKNAVSTYCWGGVSNEIINEGQIVFLHVPYFQPATCLAAVWNQQNWPSTKTLDEFRQRYSLVSCTNPDLVTVAYDTALWVVFAPYLVPGGPPLENAALTCVSGAGYGVQALPSANYWPLVAGGVWCYDAWLAVPKTEQNILVPYAMQQVLAIEGAAAPIQNCLFAVATNGTPGLIYCPVPDPTRPPGPPGPATNVVATKGDRNATVTWTPPTDAGGGTLLKAAVTAYDVSTTLPDPLVPQVTVCGTCSTAVVGGLSNGNRYYFVVNVYNSAETFSTSAPSNLVTPSNIPDPPGNVYAVPASSTTANVSWTAPAYNGGSAITRYDIDTLYASGPHTGQMAVLTQSTCGTCTSITIVGLLAGQSYYFRVTDASGSGGSNSANSNVINTTAGPPGPPTSVSAVAHLGLATVTWSPPTNTGGASIDHYAVSAYHSNGLYAWLALQVSVCGTCTSATVVGLNDALAYFFRVYAVTYAGSNYADSNTVTPTGAPGPGSLATYGVNLGSAAIATDSSGNKKGSLDGFKMLARVPAMDVPVCYSSCTQFLSSTYVGPGGQIDGANARPMQLGAQDALGLRYGEFIGFGYFAGNALHKTSGLTSDGHVYKKYYVDGCSHEFGMCSSTSTGPGYFLDPLAAVSAGEWHNFQVQRRWNGTAGTYEYAYWIDLSPVYWGSTPLTTHQVMAHSMLSMGTESSTALGPHQNVLGLEHLYFNIYSHQNGKPSASPPSYTNMNLEWLLHTASNSGPNCHVTTTRGYSYVTILGRC